jgi:hypothetical protein
MPFPIGATAPSSLIAASNLLRLPIYQAVPPVTYGLCAWELGPSSRPTGRDCRRIECRLGLQLTRFWKKPMWAGRDCARPTQGRSRWSMVRRGRTGEGATRCAAHSLLPRYAHISDRLPVPFDGEALPMPRARFARKFTHLGGVYQGPPPLVDARRLGPRNPFALAPARGSNSANTPSISRKDLPERFCPMRQLRPADRDHASYVAHIGPKSCPRRYASGREKRFRNCVH